MDTINFTFTKNASDAALLDLADIQKRAAAGAIDVTKACEYSRSALDIVLGAEPAAPKTAVTITVTITAAT